MKAMILAAGEGTRLRPLTYHLPKPLVPILNRPVIDYVLEFLSKNGIDEVMINLHYKADMIKNHLCFTFLPGIKVSYSIESSPLGTAGGVKAVEDFFDDTFVVIGGDDLCDVDLEEVVEFHHRRKALATIGLYRVDEVEQYGVVVTDDTGKITQFQEKPRKSEAKSNWANTGIYVFEPEIFKFIPKNSFFDFGKNLFPTLKEKNLAFYGYKSEGYWKDVGNLVEYRAAQFDILQGKTRFEIPGRKFLPGVWVGKNVKLSSKCTIKGPVIIGDNCVLKPEVCIEGPAVIGSNNVFEKGAKLSRSIVWTNNYLGRHSSLDNCLMGSDCRIENGKTLKKTVMGSNMRGMIEDFDFKSVTSSAGSLNRFIKIYMI